MDTNGIKFAFLRGERDTIKINESFYVEKIFKLNVHNFKPWSLFAYVYFHPVMLDIVESYHYRTLQLIHISNDCHSYCGRRRFEKGQLQQ